MLPYFLLFVGALVLYPTSHLSFAARARGQVLQIPVFPAFLLVLFIGLRFEVGGDWAAYIGYLNRAYEFNFVDLFLLEDPAYQLINWIAASFAAEVWLVNLISAAIFTYGLIRFANSLPDPKLAIVVAIPYLVMVVAMGYQRQGIALGLLMAGLPHLFQRRIVKYTAFVVLAATFHKSAIVMLPFAVLASTRNRWLMYPALLAIGYFSYQALVADALDSLVVGYIDAVYQSQGALIRVLMCVLPSIIFLILFKRYQLFGFQKSFWLIMSIVSVCTLGALFFSSSSTAIDRLALYLIPIQLFVFSGLPEIFSAKRHVKKHGFVRLLIVLYSLVVMVVWLVFAGHRGYWVPYNFYPLFD
ncbi:EpsG family protein [uncultured Limnobacter sp.]|uniref:EpsG family protein n=1 Tax=uncultured Limnobacter sp. TaxID=199681 RepID=UPI0030FA14BF